VEYQINEGIDAIIVCGTTGESSTMTLEEKKALVKFSKDAVANKIDVEVNEVTILRIHLLFALQLLFQ